MLYYIWKKGDKLSLSPNFSSSELECKCKNPTCVEQRISKDLVDSLQKLREEYNQSITITSGYRCLTHNRAIGSVDTSQHVPGNAVDITGVDLDKIYSLAEKHFQAIGDARSNKKFIHLDTRKDKKRRWSY